MKFDTVFRCYSCGLVKPKSELAKGYRNLCKDCYYFDLTIE